MAVLVASIVMASMLISAFAPGDKNSLEGKTSDNIEIRIMGL